MVGKIVKGIGGFYYVKSSDNKVFECKARGIFRKSHITPLVGDNVRFSVNADAQNTVDEIFARKNFLVRPPVANVDNLIIVSSVTDPKPNLFVIDQMTAIARFNDIEPILVFNKTDTASAEEYLKVYKNVGFKCFGICAKNGEGVEELKSVLNGKTSVFTGNSGVGKSSILNCLDEKLNLQTGETSKKLGRGRHTTRNSELFDLCGGFVVDTAGFSAIDMDKMQIIRKDELQHCFPEFEDYIGSCKFVSCSHTKEKGCSIINAFNEGKIESSRFDSYNKMYEQVKNLKEWEIKK